nr:hypothetical protein Iba_scaffold93852CG0010 [Ipomoea batatas]
MAGPELNGTTPAQYAPVMEQTACGSGREAALDGSLSLRSGSCTRPRTTINAKPKILRKWEAALLPSPLPHDLVDNTACV